MSKDNMILYDKDIMIHLINVLNLFIYMCKVMIFVIFEIQKSIYMVVYHEPYFISHVC